ncbi:MAG: hypothetical protein C0417_11405 [Chlorobiaceae bacterium]|nr:hypothetical protein [Chlorobiaceae bacterium]
MKHIKQNFTFLRCIVRILFILQIIVGFTCKDKGTEPLYNLNPYLKEIKFLDPKKTGIFHMAVWRDSTIYAIQQFSRFIIDKNYNVQHDTILLDVGIYEKYWTYIDADVNGSKILLVASRFRDASSGALYEYDRQTGNIQMIYDRSHNISSARYFPNDVMKIVYYSYGDDNFVGAGYYLHDKTTNRDSLLFSYISTAGPTEMLNGFDIHPNGNSLLIPISHSTPLMLKPPKLGKVSLSEQKLDTLNINFSFSKGRSGLWVRYNKDASKILYCCFPYGAYTAISNDGSEVGIIESSTMNKRIIDVNTQSNTKYLSVQLAPNWSPDEKAIIFGSGNVSIEGSLGRRHLYILTKIE